MHTIDHPLPNGAAQAKQDRMEITKANRITVVNSGCSVEARSVWLNEYRQSASQTDVQVYHQSNVGIGDYTTNTKCPVHGQLQGKPRTNAKNKKQLRQG